MANIENDVRVCVYLTLTPDEFALFNSNNVEVERSIEARLDEIFTPAGDPINPYILGVEVEWDEVDDEPASSEPNTAALMRLNEITRA